MILWLRPGRIGIALSNVVANLAGFGAPAAMVYLRERPGAVATGLLPVAAFEFATMLLILGFVPAADPESRDATADEA